MKFDCTLKSPIFVLCLFLSTFQFGFSNSGDTFCFNANLPAEEVAFLLDDCNTAPLLVCASTYFGCPNDSIDPSNTGYTIASPGDSDCPEPELTYDDTVMVDEACELTIKRIWTAVYPDGASPWLFSTCTQMLFLVDDPVTVSNCPTNQVIDLSTNGCDDTATWTLPTWEEDCGLQTVSSSAQPGDVFPLGTTTVTYLAVDYCGNEATCEFTITVIGTCCTDNPIITCPADYFACPGESQSPTVTGSATAVSSDDCDTAVITFDDVTISDDACNTLINRVWTATYPGTTQSASCTQKLTYVDNTGPSITGVPQNINLTANGSNCTAVATWNEPSQTDNCGVGSFNSTHLSGSSFNEGTTTVTYTAIDACGNSNTASFLVTVTCECNTPPTITCPANVVECPFSSIDPASTGTATALAGNSICGTPTVTYNDVTIIPQTSCGEITIERTWTATDPNDASLTASCIQTLTHVDDSNPVITNMPGNIELTAPLSNCSVAANWLSPTTSDNCGAVNLTSTHTSGSTFTQGVTTVTYTAVDGCGNSVSASFTVTVTCECDTPPSITCPASVTDCPGSSISPTVLGTATATSITGCGTPVITFVDNVTVPANSCGETTIIRTWTATDENDSSLSSSCDQVITHVDSTDPVLSGIPSDIVISLTGSGCSSIATWTLPSASDNCIAVNLTSTHDSGDTFTEGTTTVTYTATDGCANSVSDSFTVTVECVCDGAPIIQCPSNYFGCVNASQDPSNTGQATASNPTAGCGDNIEITYVDTYIQNTSCIKEIIRIWTATDLDNGQSSTCNQFLGLYDTQKPVFNSGPTDLVVSGSGLGCTAVATWTEPNVTDDCGIASITSTHTSGSTFNEGVTTVVYTATDDCGKTTSYSFTVTVECDCTGSFTIACPANYFGCIGESDTSITGVATFVGEDGCGPYEVTYNDILITDSACATEIARIWTVTDLTSGATSVCSQFIGLYDTQIPTITNGPSDILIEGEGKGCQEIVTWTLPTATDDCGIASFTSTHQSGDAFPEGNTIVVYTAVDNCGKTTSYSFNVLVECSCSISPLVQCPINYFGCIGDSIEPAVIGTATFNEVDGCGPVELTSSDNVITDTGCILEIVRTWTAFDTTSGLTSSCTQFIGLYDMVAPSLASVPADIYLESNGTNCSAIATWTAPVASDNCGEVTLTSSHASGSTFSEGITVVTYTATDGCGRTTTATFNVTVNCVCNLPPSITCPQDYLACPGSDATPATTGTAIGTAVDGCDAPNVTFADTTVDNGCGETITRTWTATDPHDSSLATSCTQTITLTDTEAPAIINCPHNVTIDGGGVCSKPILWFEPSATDNCSEPILTSNLESGSTFSEGTTEVIYTATDDCGNASTCSFNVTIICNNCNQPPVITCPSDVIVCIGDDMLPSGTGTATAVPGSVDCTGTPTITFNDVMLSNGPCNGQLVIERTWTATDPDSGLSSTCTQMVSSEDNAAPIFTNVPDNIILTGDASDCQAIATWLEPTVTDNCTAITVTSTVTSGSTFNEGTTTVVYTAIDACGNTSTASFNVTLTCDCNSIPSIVCPADYNGCAGSSIEPGTTGFANASAGAGCNIPTLTYSDDVIIAANSCGEETIERTWTATDPDNSALTVSCVQTITLTDNTSPVFLTVPGNIEVDAPGSDCFVDVTWETPTFSDNCTAVTLTSTAQSGDTFGEAGVYTVTYTATDACGNAATASFTITVTCICDEVPVIACPSDYNACPSTSTDPSVTGTATAIPGWACSNPTVTYSDNITNPMNSCGEITIERTWSATDPGNATLVTTCIQIITLSDNENPVFSGVPTDVTIDGGDGPNCSAAYTWTAPTASDNCDSAVTLTANQTNGATFPMGVTVVTFTATDACGNIATASFEINVVCTSGSNCLSTPTITCPADFYACVGSNYQPNITGYAVGTAGDSSCNEPNVTYADVVVATGDCAGSKTIERTWTATDPFNTTLIATCIQTLTLADDVNPVLTDCPVDMTVTGTADCDAVVNWTAPTTADNCSSVSLTSNFASGSAFWEGTTTVTYIATDMCGNSSTCSFDITVVCQSPICDTPPAITCPGDAVLCIGSSIAPSILGQPIVTGSADCPTPNVIFSDYILNTGPCTGAKVIDRVWTANYPGTSLSTSCTQSIVIADEAKPVILGCPASITVENQMTIVNWTAPTVIDNCGVASFTSSHNSGSYFPVGVTTVVYTAVDNCGNTEYCSFTVTVDDSMSNPLTCPDDIVVGCDNNGGANVTWSTPTYETGCNPCSGTNIPGFIFMGSYDGHQYYCSTSPATWQSAQANCTSNGGYLAIVNDASENAFLASLLTIQSAYIGLSDHVTEGNFQWVNGDPLTYTNWYADQPNDFNNAQDYVEMLNNGQWNDQYAYSALEYIMEVPCSGVIQTAGPSSGTYLQTGSYTVEYTVYDGCNDGESCSFNITVEPSISINCPDDVTLTTTGSSMLVNWQTPTASSCCSNCSNGGNIPGFIYMGNYEGHNYYCSNSPATWLNAQTVCSDLGGYLAVVNNAGENAFLANILTIQSAYIGLSDHVNEGQFQWVNGEELTYTNWYQGQPNNYNDEQDFCEMLNDGTWNDQYNYKALEYIMEIPGCINVSQTAGPASGSIFTAGTTTAVSYIATDQCGNSDVCTFNITIEGAGCVSGGLNSSSTWIEGVKFGNLENASGDNNGYADFTDDLDCVGVTPGNSYHLKLEPGYGVTNPIPVYWSAWIDYNMDGDYTDANEFIAYGAGTQPLSGVITMPSVLWNGITTMRVVMKTGGYPSSPCLQFNYGETEDYCIRVYGAGDLTQDNVDVREVGMDAILLEDGLTEAASLSVYPSPATSYINLDLTLPADSNIESAEIYDLQGQIITTINPVDNSLPTVDVSRYTSGIYLVRVGLSDGSLLNERFVVKK